MLPRRPFLLLVTALTTSAATAGLFRRFSRSVSGSLKKKKRVVFDSVLCDRKYELVGELYDDRICIVDYNRSTEVLLIEGLRTGHITASVLPTTKTDQKHVKLFTLPAGAYRGYLLGPGPHEIDMRASTVAFNSEVITGKKANLDRVQEVFATDDRVASDEDFRSGRELVWTDGNVKVEQKSRHETFYSEKRQDGNWTQMIEMQRWEYILSVPGLPFK
ncbi:hypothetical protein FOZ63_013836, partial [Perkinsus olseni]